MNKISTGLDGLDEILYGGFIPKRSYLLRGGPGSGKSSIGYHFLKHALNRDKQVLYITLGEPKEQILENAQHIGMDLSGIHFVDLTPSDDIKKHSTNYNVFSASEIEQPPIFEAITGAIEKYKPERVVLDSVTMLRFLNQDAYNFRHTGLSFIKYIVRRGATLLLISESSEHINDQDSVFWVDGILDVEYSTAWRKLYVSKFRGSDFMHGNHAFKIDDKGVTIFPRLHPNRYENVFKNQVLSSGIDQIDHLLHGGIEKGTTTLITGASGVGKTNLGIQFINEAATRNERSAIYTFEESKELILRRSKMINIPIDEMIQKGNLKIVPVEPLSYSPDEFSAMVKKDIEDHDTQMVMIDTIGAYSMAVRDENTLERLHSLTVYLQNMGITTFLINESSNITGDLSATTMHASYLADNIIFLRYLEIQGKIRKAIGVLKKRLSSFENVIREYEITTDGIKVGKPLKNLRGILTGMPELIK